MAIPKIKREAYDGKLDIDDSIPDYVRYMYCNCVSGVRGMVVLMSTAAPVLVRTGSLYSSSYRCVATLHKLPIITDKHQRMCVEVV